MFKVLIVYNDAPNETAIISCESFNDALHVRQSFINYGKCKSVIIEEFK